MHWISAFGLVLKKSGTLASIVYRRSKTAPNNAADAPLGLRMAATMTSVSKTNRYMMLNSISHTYDVNDTFMTDQLSKRQTSSTEY